MRLIAISSSVFAFLLLGCRGEFTYEYDPFVIESKHYTVITDFGETESKEIAKMMDVYFQFLMGIFKFEDPEDKLHIRVFRKRDSFKKYLRSRWTRAQEWVYGYYFSSRPKELVVYWDRKYRGIFFHEGFHQFADRYWPNSGGWPDWLGEGLASYMSNAKYLEGQIQHNSMASKDDRVNTAKFLTKNKGFQISEFMEKTRNWNKNGNDYSIAACFIEFLLNHPDSRVQQELKYFFRGLRETGSYRKCIDDFWGTFNSDHINAAFYEEYASLS